MSSPLIDAIIFDLDGVIRHYDRDHERDIELRFGLEAGSLLHAAFGGDLGHRFMCGMVDHDQFADELAQELGSAAAAAEFVSMRAEVDPEAVELVLELQRRFPVALLTNGSTRTDLELAEAGLGSVFDHVFNSASTGVPKPHPDAYLNVVAALGHDVSRTGFIDDSQVNVVGATAAGLVGHHYLGIGELRVFLRSAGLL